jgi:hypothetical protein
MARTRNPWFGIGMDAWSLGMEASSVIALRTLKIAAGGPGADAEAELMVNEKVQSAMSLGVLAWTGGLGLTVPTATSRTLTHYRRKVRSNRRRLMKG